MNESKRNTPLLTDLTPALYLDFDGVINAFPDNKVLRRGGIGHTGWLKDDDPRKQLYSEARAFRLDGNKQARTNRGRYRIHYSTTITDGLKAMAETGRISLHWLTTWQDYCENTLNPLLGWDGRYITTEYWYDPETGARRKTGKRRTVYEAIRRRDRPIIWVDDEECYDARLIEIEALQPKWPVLMIRPDERIGISRRQWELIQRFASTMETFPPAALDEEETVHAHDKHIGF